MNDFIRRNEIRKKQFAYQSEWTKQVADRVQLYEDWRGHKAWESATIIGLEPKPIIQGENSNLIHLQMDDGDFLSGEYRFGSGMGWLTTPPIVAHEDYFKDESRDD